MFLCFSFHLFKDEEISFSVWNNKKSKLKKFMFYLDVTIMDYKKPTAFIAKAIIIVNGWI